jgi:hypothetical protein
MAATYIDSQSPGDAAEPVNLPLFISEPMIKIAQFHEQSRKRDRLPIYSSSRI